MDYLTKIQRTVLLSFRTIPGGHGYRNRPKRVAMFNTWESLQNKQLIVKSECEWFQLTAEGKKWIADYDKRQAKKSNG